VAWSSRRCALTFSLVRRAYASAATRCAELLHALAGLIPLAFFALVLALR